MSMTNQSQSCSCACDAGEPDEPETLTLDMVAFQESLGKTAVNVALEDEDAAYMADQFGLDAEHVLTTVQELSDAPEQLEFADVPPPGEPQQVYRIGKVTFLPDGAVDDYTFSSEARGYYFLGKEMVSEEGLDMGPDEPATSD